MANTKPAKPKKFVMPKTDGAKADLLYETRQKRYALNKEVAALEAIESEIENYFIDHLSAKDATGVSGYKATVLIERKPAPVVEDWEKFYAYIRKNNSFFLLNKAVSKSGVKELWENNKQVPGVTKIDFKTVSCTKRK